MHFAFFQVTEVFFLSCSQTGHTSSTLLMDIHRGMPTSQTWWKIIYGVIMWFSTVRQTALKLASTWSVVWGVTMTEWFAKSLMLLVATGLCSVTWISFTMLVSFRIKEVKMSDLRWPEPIYMCVTYVFVSRFQNERFNLFLRFLASLINDDGTLRKCYLLSCRFKNLWDIGIYLKPHFYEKTIVTVELAAQSAGQVWP